MRLTVDEHPAGALGSCRADPSFRGTGRPRGPRRDRDRRHALASEDRVEDAGDLGVTVADRETEGAGPAAGVHEQVAGVLGSPPAVRAGGHARAASSPPWRTARTGGWGRSC